MEDAGTDGSGRAPNHNVDRSAKSPTEDAAELRKKAFYYYLCLYLMYQLQLCQYKAIKKWQTLLPNIQNVNLRVGGIIVNISSIFVNKNIWQNQAFSFAFFRLFGCYTWCWTVSHPSRSLPYQSQPSSNPLMASLYLILHSYLMLRNGGSISCICIYIFWICLFFFFFISRNSQAALF